MARPTPVGVSSIVSVRFRDGARLPRRLDAGKVERRLMELYQAHNQLNPELVLSDARKRMSPLHGAFNWDVKKAAEQYWLVQARHLLGSIIITFRAPDGTVVPARRFLYVPESSCAVESEDGRYLSIEQVMSDEDLRAQQVEQALLDLRRWQARWAFLDGELEGIFRAIREHIGMDRAA